MSSAVNELCQLTNASELSNLLESDKFGIYSAKTYMALDGVTDAYTELYALINTTIAGAHAEIWFKYGTALIGTNITIPSNVKLKFLHGGMLKPASGKVITGSNARIEAGLHQIFDLSDSGVNGLAGTWNVLEFPIVWLGCSTTPGFDNQPYIGRLIDLQITYSSTSTVIHQLFDIIIPFGTWEINSPIYLSPFITIRGICNHIQTPTPRQGCILNAVGTFLNKAIIDTAAYKISTGLRDPLLDESAGNIYDTHTHNPCGNVTLKNFFVKSDDRYTVADCAFEAIHLCGSSGSVVEEVYTANTIIGMTMQASWQFKVNRNVYEHYWIGLLTSGNTMGQAHFNYCPRNATQRLTVWGDLNSRGFLNELGAGGTSYLAEKAIGIINIRGGVDFIGNDVEATVYGFGCDYTQNDWVMRIRNTYMEKITTGYIVDTTNSFDIELGTCAVMTNLFDINFSESDSFGTSMPAVRIISAQGTEFIQSKITNVGSVTSDNTLASVHMINFLEAVQTPTNYVYWDTITRNVRALNFYGSDGSKTGITLYQTTDNAAIAAAGTLNFLPFYSRTQNQNPATNRDAAGISVSCDSGINADNRGSWQMLNRDYFGVSLRVRLSGGAWSSWYHIQDARSCVTGDRATTAPTPTTGQMIFDTTLGIPIWWNGSAWVNSAGTGV